MLNAAIALWGLLPDEASEIGDRMVRQPAPLATPDAALAQAARRTGIEVLF